MLSLFNSNTYLSISSLFFLVADADFIGDLGFNMPLKSLTVLELLLLLTADGVVGICSSLFGVVVDEVGVGSADVMELTTVFTLPMIGDDESTIIGEFNFFTALLPAMSADVVKEFVLFVLSLAKLFEAVMVKNEISPLIIQ